MTRTSFFCRVFLSILCLLACHSAMAENGFEIHFLDVGQADAAIIICDDEVMMIDGGNSGSSSFVYSYLRNTLLVEHIDYMIASHPHADHIGGLSGALNACTVGKVYSPVLEYDSKAFRSLKKYTTLQGKDLALPCPGESFALGRATVQLIGPLREYESSNEASIIVRIVYDNTSFLFTGDAEWESEHDLVDSEYELSATLLKVAHHGSETSSSYVFLREVMPAYAIISVGEDNSYGHPSEAVLSRLHDAETVVYRTDLHGNIICYSDGHKLTFETECISEAE